MANTILLKGRGIRVEAVAGGAITPGHLLTRDATGKLVVFNTAGGAAPRIFAVENDIVGKEIKDAYAANDYVQAEHLHSGCEALGFVIAGGAAIVIGDLLEAGGAGGFRKLNTGVAIAQALEAVDNSAGGTQARIKVALL
jgi:hypothetical protein